MKKITKVPIYGVTILMFDSCEEAAEYIGDEELQEWSSDMDGFCITLGGVVHLVVDSKCFNPGLLAHEALHASWAVLKRVSVEVEEANHEALAYVLAWMVDEWHRKMAPKQSTTN